MTQYKVKLKLNVDVGGYFKGDIIEVKSDKAGNVRDNYWARRLDESALDGCVEKFVPEKKEAPEPKEIKPKAEKK